MAKGEQPIIIKKIKKGGGGGHHGGAWKVAYADFVTAMMAFFLLMWLLNATEAEQLAGLADYFAPTVGVQGEMGIGFRGGKGAISDGIGASNASNKGIVFGGVPSGPVMKVMETITKPTQLAEAEKLVVASGGDKDEDEGEQIVLEKTAEQLQAEMDAAGNLLSGMNESIDLKQTIEGLEITIKDIENNSMFKPGSVLLENRAKIILDRIAEVAKQVPNYLSITGHATERNVSEDPNYTIWELSADRANATRRYLLAQGLEPDRIGEVVGKADNEPLDPERPERAMNNRITIVLLRDAVLPHHKQVIPEELFTNGK